MNISHMKLVAFADAYHGTIAGIESDLSVYGMGDLLVSVLDDSVGPVQIKRTYADHSKDSIDAIIRWMDSASGWNIDTESIKYL